MGLDMGAMSNSPMMLPKLYPCCPTWLRYK